MTYPIPRRENELRGTATGPVVTYTLSEDELARIRRETAISPNAPKQSRPIDLKIKTNPNALTKEKYLLHRIAGKSKADICKEHGLQPITLKTKISKWGLLKAQQEREAINAYMAR